MRVDYQRISQEAYESREDEIPGRFDRTTLTGAVIIGVLGLVPILLACVLARDLMHQSLAQTVENIRHTIEPRAPGP